MPCSEHISRGQSAIAAPTPDRFESCRGHHLNSVFAAIIGLVRAESASDVTRSHKTYARRPHWFGRTAEHDLRAWAMPPAYRPCCFREAHNSSETHRRDPSGRQWIHNGKIDRLRIEPPPRRAGAARSTCQTRTRASWFLWVAGSDVNVETTLVVDR
jgi:hypothetical protein